MADAIDTTRISEGDARVLLSRYMTAARAVAQFDGDPDSGEAHRLEAESEKHKARIIQSMVGASWHDDWKHD